MKYDHYVRADGKHCHIGWFRDVGVVEDEYTEQECPTCFPKKVRT